MSTLSSTSPLAAAMPFAMALSACAYWADPTSGSPPPATPAIETAAMVTPTAVAPERGTVVRLRESNTVGASLAPRLAAAFLTHLGASDATVHEERKAQDTITVTGTVSGHPVTFNIDSPGTKVAFECLADASCDIGMASRPISAEEAATLTSLGDMASPAAEHVIGLDGIAVIVNPANRVSRLTVAQIEGLFAGTIANWSQVEGAPGEVHPFIRDRKSGTYDTFIQLVTHGRDLPTD